MVMVLILTLDLSMSMSMSVRVSMRRGGAPPRHRAAHPSQAQINRSAVLDFSKKHQGLDLARHMAIKTEDPVEARPDTVCVTPATTTTTRRGPVVMVEDFSRE